MSSVMDKVYVFVLFLILNFVFVLMSSANVKSMKKMVRQTYLQLSLWWMVAQKGLKAMPGLFSQG